MKLHKKLLVVFFLLIGLATTSQAQFYKSAIGLRLGSPAVSASFKTFFAPASAIELYAGIQPYTFGSFFNVSAAYQHHFPIESVEGLQWYLGGGLGVYFFSYKNTYIGTAGNTSIGVQAYGGAEYTFADIPLTVMVDWIPTIFIGDGYYNNFRGGYGGIGARYILSR